MTRGRLVFGLLIASGVGLAVTIGVRRCRRRLVPGWVGLEGVLADIVLMLSVVTVCADALGTFGWFSAWTLAAGLVLIAALLAWFGHGPRGLSAHSAQRSRRPSAMSGDTSHLHEPRWAGWLVALGVGVAAAIWLRPLVVAYRIGIGSSDALWYHLPIVADFVRTGSFLGLHLYSADIAVSTYPAGYEVFGAVVVLVAGSDFLLPLVNAAFATLLLVAAHTFGRRFGNPHLATLAALVFLVLPVSVLSMSANAMNEVMAVALLVVGLVFVVAATPPESARARLFLVGLSAGLVAAVKFAMLGPAVVLVIAALVIESRLGVRAVKKSVLPLVAGVAVTGGYWYFRNVWRFGSPVPELSASLGGWSLPHVDVVGKTGPMLPTLVRGLWDGSEQPFLTYALGPFWWLVLLAPVLVLGVLATDRSFEVKTLAVASSLMYLMGLYTPQYLIDGAYVDIQWNTRYLMSGLCTAPIVGVAVLKRGRQWTIGIVVVVAVLLTGSAYNVAHPNSYLWMADGPLAQNLWLPVLSGAIALVGFGLLRSGRMRPCTVWSLTGVAGLVVVAMLVMQLPTYLDGRYRVAGYAPSLYAWADSHSHRRIAVAPDDVVEGITAIVHGDAVASSKGALSETYPLLGKALSNAVAPIAWFDGARVVRPESCAQWWAQIQRLKATEVLVWEPPPGHARLPGQEWTERSKAATLILRSPIGPAPSAHLVLFAVDRTVPPSC